MVFLTIAVLAFSIVEDRTDDEIVVLSSHPQTFALVTHSFCEEMRAPLPFFSFAWTPCTLSEEVNVVVVGASVLTSSVIGDKKL